MSLSTKAINKNRIILHLSLDNWGYLYQDGDVVVIRSNRSLNSDWYDLAR